MNSVLSNHHAGFQSQGYCRGYIWHHRSNATQQWLFHFMYGGFKNFFIKRYVIDYGLKTVARMFWFPVALGLIGYYLSQREIDNRLYAEHYISD